MRKITLHIAVVLCVLLLIIVLFFEQTFAPIEKKRQEAMQLAIGNELITQVENYYYYVSDQNVHTLYGKNKDNDTVYVFVMPTEQKAFAFYDTHLFNEQKVRQLSEQRYPNFTIAKITAGLKDEQPIWEIVLYDQNKHIGYDIISAQTGDILKQIRTEVSK